jgi:hypothetical protein
MPHELFPLFIGVDSLRLILITRFSLPYEEAVGLVIGMYCNNNALCFVLVARDLLEGVDMITGILSLNFGLRIRIRMGEKKKEI